MSTPEQPTPPMTRKQMRDIRNTAANPIITGDEPPADPPVVAAPLPRPAAPVDVPPPPAPDASVDLGVNPLTRRQARQQERIRTASVPVITPDFLAAHATEATDDAEIEADPSPFAPPVNAAPSGEANGDEEPAPADKVSEAEPEAAATAESIFAPVSASATVSEVDEALATDDDPVDVSAVEDETDATVTDEAEADQIRPIVNDALGADLLLGGSDATSLPPSFDQLLSRGSTSTGSLATSNALILSQTPDSGPLVGPVTATGEVLVTGTFNLPEGLGSVGHAPGVADGKDVDAVLIDGELPPASSPTPIAASAAVSTIKGSGEIIQPPAPEKGNKLMMALAITAGVLALALVGVLVLAFATGVFA